MTRFVYLAVLMAVGVQLSSAQALRCSESQWAELARHSVSSLARTYILVALQSGKTQEEARQFAAGCRLGTKVAALYGAQSRQEFDAVRNRFSSSLAGNSDVEHVWTSGFLRSDGYWEFAPTMLTWCTGGFCWAPGEPGSRKESAISLHRQHPGLFNDIDRNTKLTRILLEVR